MLRLLDHADIGDIALQTPEQVSETVTVLCDQLDRFMAIGKSPNNNELRYREVFLGELMNYLNQWEREPPDIIKYNFLYNKLEQLKEGAVLLGALNMHDMARLELCTFPDNLFEAYRSTILADYGDPEFFSFVEEPEQFPEPPEDLSELPEGTPHRSAVSAALLFLEEHEIIARYQRNYSRLRPAVVAGIPGSDDSTIQDHSDEATDPQQPTDGPAIRRVIAIMQHTYKNGYPDHTLFTRSQFPNKVKADAQAMIKKGNGAEWATELSSLIVEPLPDERSFDRAAMKLTGRGRPPKTKGVKAKRRRISIPSCL